MAPLGHLFVSVAKGEISFDSDGTKVRLPTRRNGGPARYESVPHLETWSKLKVSCLFVHIVECNPRR